MQVEDFGDSEKALSNRQLLREKVEELRKRGVEPTENGWGGWLGRYQRSLFEADQRRPANDRSRRVSKRLAEAPLHATGKTCQSILFAKVVNDEQLTLVHPSGERDQYEPELIQDA
jgi:hypothetical protein